MVVLKDVASLCWYWLNSFVIIIYLLLLILKNNLGGEHGGGGGKGESFPRTLRYHVVFGLYFPSGSQQRQQTAENIIGERM